MIKQAFIPTHQKSLIYNAYSRQSISPSDLFFNQNFQIPSLLKTSSTQKQLIPIGFDFSFNQKSHISTNKKEVSINFELLSPISSMKKISLNEPQTSQKNVFPTLKSSYNYSLQNLQPELINSQSLLNTSQKRKHRQKTERLNLNLHQEFRSYLSLLPKRNISLPKENLKTIKPSKRNSVVFPELPAFLNKKAIKDQKQVESYVISSEKETNNNILVEQEGLKNVSNLCEELIQNIISLKKIKNNSQRIAQILTKMLGFNQLISNLLLSKNQKNIKPHLSIESLISFLVIKCKTQKLKKDDTEQILKIKYKNQAEFILVKDYKALEYFCKHMEQYLEEQEQKKIESDKQNYTNEYFKLVDAQDRYLLDIQNLGSKNYQKNQCQLEKNMKNIRSRNNYIKMNKFKEINQLEKDFGQASYICTSTRREAQSIEKLIEYYYQQIA